MISLPTIGQMLSTHARLTPNRLAARDLTRDMNYALWNERACRLANGLLALGLSKGDRIAVIAYNRLEWVEIYTAVAKAGLVAVPINFRLTASEVHYICQDCEISAVIVEDVLAEVFDQIRGDLNLPDENHILISQDAQDGWQIYEALISKSHSSEPKVIVTPKDTWCLMYTSGTTGHPKGVIRSHQGMAMLALMTQVEMGFSRLDDALLVMPMCHANSLNFFAAFLSLGATVTIFSKPNFDAELCLRTFGTLGITFSSLTPTHFMMMLDVPPESLGGWGFQNVKKLIVSSAPARVDTKKAIMKMFPNSGLYELYGSTEAGWVTFLHPEELFGHVGTVGREVVGSAPIKLLDESGKEVPDGTPGELFSCGPYAFDGYWNLPEKTTEAFRGTYLSVGDIALRDKDGFIRLIDRKKNMIISGGENVYPTEVETVLAQHPEVKDVAVVGCPDQKWGERVAAAVVRTAGSTLSQEALIAWSKDKLAKYKCPKEVVFLSTEEMPRNATGKILHRVLRERFASNPN